MCSGAVRSSKRIRAAAERIARPAALSSQTLQVVPHAQLGPRLKRKQGFLLRISFRKPQAATDVCGRRIVSLNRMNSSGLFLHSLESLLLVPLSKLGEFTDRNHEDDDACGRRLWRAAVVVSQPAPVEVSIISAADYVCQHLNRKYLRRRFCTDYMATFASGIKGDSIPFAGSGAAPQRIPSPTKKGDALSYVS